MTTLELSKILNSEHRSIVKVIRQNKTQFESIGNIIEKSIKTQGRPTKYFDLNENQISFNIIRH